MADVHHRAVEEIEAALVRLKQRCWGAFGDDDTMGTLNWITPAVRADAANTIVDGLTVSLSRPLRVGHYGERALYQSPPTRKVMMAATDPVDEGSVPWNIEAWSFTYHGYVISHIDDWTHCSWHGEAYGGRHASDLVNADHHFTQGSHAGIFARGVLFDAAPEGGWLEPGASVTAATLEDLERKMLDRQVGQGDIVFVRTGMCDLFNACADIFESCLTGQTRAMRECVGGFSPSRGMPACHWDVCEWLCSRKVAALGSDSANDCQPAIAKKFTNPVHVLCLVGMGMPLLDNLDLESLAAVCREKGRYSFAVSICPLSLQGGTGSPVNPIALF